MSDELIIRPSILKYIFIAIGGLIFFFIGYWMLGQGDTDVVQKIAAYFCFIFGAPLAVYTLIIPFSPKNYLKLMRDGFEISSIFQKRYYRWEEVSEFKIWKHKGTKIVMFDCSTANQNFLSTINKSLTGASKSLPTSYRISGKKLAALMNEWRTAALSA